MEYMGKKIWEEDPGKADGFRQRYVDGIEKYIEHMNNESKKMRRNYMPPEKLVCNQELYRDKYREMLGIESFIEKSTKPVEVQYVGQDDISRIYRLVIYINDDIPFYSMLLLPNNIKSPIPLIIAQHGGGGTPELCSDMNGVNNYNHMVQRAIARGAAVLAPQLLLWSMTETATMRSHAVSHDRKKIDVDLKRFGSSITALEICGIMKSLDYVCTMEEIDSSKVAMIGLSYGGYFTLHTMAADIRIKAGYCAGVFNDRDVYDWADWSYKESALKYQDAEVAALCAPRKLFIQVGKQDPVFNYHSAVDEGKRIYDYYAAFNSESNYHFSVWDGGHTISDDDSGYDFIFSAFCI